MALQFSGAESYEATFQQLLCNKKLHIVCAEEFGIDIWCRSKAGLDIMGSGVVLDDMFLSHGLGVALTDARSLQMKKEHGSRIHVVAGDILFREIWAQISGWINSRRLPNPFFHVVLFRPIGGMNYLPQDPDNVHQLMHNIWQVTSSNHGHIFCVYRRRFMISPMLGCGF